MEIQGRIVTTDNPSRLPVAIVTVGSRQIGSAVIVADFANDTVCAHGQSCIDLLGRAANGNGLFGRWHKVELATQDGAKARVEMVVSCADDGDLIVFQCATADIFSIAWCALNVRNAS